MIGGASLLVSVIEVLSEHEDSLVAVRAAVELVAARLAARDVVLIWPTSRAESDEQVIAATGQVDPKELVDRFGTLPTDGLLGSEDEPVVVLQLRHGERRLGSLVLCAEPGRGLNSDQLMEELAPVCKVLAIAMAQGRARRRLGASERQYREVVEGVRSIILRFDATGRILFVNDYGARMLGFLNDELLGKNVVGTIVCPPPGQAIEPERLMSEVRAHPEKFLFSEMELPRSDGSSGWVSWTNHPVLDARGYLVEILSVGHDISRRKELEAELRRLATTDSLTGAANRRQFFASTEREARRASRHERPLSLLMLDVDHFKQINDHHGHDVGDRALRRLVSICREELRDTDTVGRLGGEEFGILLPETTLEAAAQVAERLRSALAGDALGVASSVSVGVAEMHDAEPIQSLVKRADQALYRAKNAGRDRVVVAPSAAAGFAGGFYPNN